MGCRRAARRGSLYGGRDSKVDEEVVVYLAGLPEGGVPWPGKKIDPFELSGRGAGGEGPIEASGRLED